MKDLIGIKRRQLEYYRSNGFWDSVKKSAGMHGYFGFWKTLHFLWIKTLDSLYNRISYFSPYNGLRLYCQRKRGVKVGKEVLIGMHCVLDEVFPDFITIEDGACLAGRVYVLTHSNAPVFFRNRLPSYVAPVIIKKNAWITVNVTILPGVTIGEGSVITAGSVVRQDIPPNVIAGGDPAEIIVRFKKDE